VPAVRDLGRVLEVVPAVLALLFSLRLPLEHRVVGQVPRLDRKLLVDLLGFRFGDLVVSHGVDLPLFDGRDATSGNLRALHVPGPNIGRRGGSGDDGTRTHDPLLAKQVL
jgi:hypothetical protein